MAGTTIMEQDLMEEGQLNNRVQINREVFNQHDFDIAFGYTPLDRPCNCAITCRHACNWIRSECRCSRPKLRSFFHRHLPVLSWLPKYSIRRDLIYDIIGGLTIGVMHIPQGMAYGELAGLKQVNGLYVSFFSSLVYFFFGTSRHISIGTFAVVSIMMSNVRDRFIPADTPNGTVHEVMQDFPPDVTSLELETSVTALVGIVMVCMGILRLGFLTCYLSDALISGFTTGAALHVFVTQFPPILGLPRTKCDEIGKLWCSIAYLFHAYRQLNWVTSIISVACIIFVYFMKDWIGPIFKRKLNVPLPSELIAIIIGTVASYFGGFNTNYGVAVVGSMPKGLPPPTVPRFDYAPWIIGDSISIAIVIFSVTISMAKTFAKKHNYRVDPNQELYGLGLVNCFCSFFGCFPPSGSLARSVLFESTGARTQVAAVIGCGLIFVVLMWLGPLFYYLPKCVLSAIIVVALKGMFMQFKELKTLLRMSKIDALIWISSFLAVACLGLTYGLAASVAVGLLTIILRMQWPNAAVPQWIPGTELYRDGRLYQESQCIFGVRIFRFDAPLNFANAELFISRLFRKCEVDVERAKTYLRTCPAFPPSPPAPLQRSDRTSTPVCSLKEAPLEEKENADDAEDDSPQSSPSAANSSSPAFGVVSLQRSVEGEPLVTEYIIIDCTSISYVDMMGLNVLKQAYQELSDIGIRVLFAACRASLRSMFEASDFHKTVPRECLYVSVHDAVVMATGGNIVGLRADGQL